jgi:hypothetical protein
MSMQESKKRTKPVHISGKDFLLIWIGVIFGTVASRLLDELLAESNCSRAPNQFFPAVKSACPFCSRVNESKPLEMIFTVLA